MKLVPKLNLFVSDDFIRDNYYVTSNVTYFESLKESVVIAHYPNFTFGIRLMAGWEVSKFINPKNVKENLVAVSKIIKDAHMTRTEKIIMESGK